jgi:hypothetical protein
MLKVQRLECDRCRRTFFVKASSTVVPEKTMNQDNDPMQIRFEEVDSPRLDDVSSEISESVDPKAS